MNDINNLLTVLSQTVTANEILLKVYEELILFRNAKLSKETFERIEDFVENTLQKEERS